MGFTLNEQVVSYLPGLLHTSQMQLQIRSIDGVVRASSWSSAEISFLVIVDVGSKVWVSAQR